MGGYCFTGRAATVSALVTHFRDSDAAASLQHDGQRWRLPSVFALNVFRLGAALAAIVGCLAAVLLGAASSRPSQPSPGSALLIALTVIMLVWLAWSTLNWFLSLAAIFVLHGQDTFRLNGRRRRFMPGSPWISIRGGDLVRIGPHHSIRRREFGDWLSFRICRSPSVRRSAGRRLCC